VSDIESSTLVVDSVAGGNVAFNTLSSTDDALGNDAVAGSQVVVGNARDSNLLITTDSFDNTAVAINGDAVAGNQVTIGQTDADTIVALDLTSSNNNAVSIDGDAVVDNDVTVGGDANVIGYP